jgi:hypothetical protein
MKQKIIVRHIVVGVLSIVAMVTIRVALVAACGHCEGPGAGQEYNTWHCDEDAADRSIPCSEAMCFIEYHQPGMFIRAQCVSTYVDAYHCQLYYGWADTTTYTGTCDEDCTCWIEGPGEPDSLLTTWCVNNQSCL